MPYLPTCKQFREARKILDITQMEVDGQTEIPQTAISQIENGKYVGKPRYKPYGPIYRERLRIFYTIREIAFPVDGSMPSRVDKRVFLSDLRKEFENCTNSARSPFKGKLRMRKFRQTDEISPVNKDTQLIHKT